MKNKNTLLAILRSKDSTAEKATHAFSRLYIAAENDDQTREVVQIFYEHHPDAARAFFISIEIPEHWLPKDFSYAGYIP